MIKKLRIRNFKSLLDTQVDLSPLTVLIGRSGTGKTNFSQAIAALQALLSAAGPQPYSELIQRLGGWDNLGPAGLSDFITSWEVVFDVDGVNGDFHYILEVKGTHDAVNGPVQREFLSVGERVLFDRIGGKWVSEPAVKVAPQQSASLGWLTALPEINITYLTLTRGIGIYDFPANVLAGNTGQTTDLGFGLKSDGSNYFSVIDGILGNLHALGTWREIEAAIKNLSASVEAITTAPFQDERVTVSYSLGGQIVGLPLSRQSGGFRRFLAHLLAIYQQPPKQVVIFEEPENGIFPGALTMLGDFMKAANEKLGTQFILTTHSPQLLDAFDPDCIRVVDISDEGTKIGPLAPEQRDAVKNNLLSPSELITVMQPDMAAEIAQGEGA
jgi:energy-coupling factor transporter ATP-binding protein EcfA2